MLKQKELRAGRNLSQEETAKEINVPQVEEKDNRSAGFSSQPEIVIQSLMGGSISTEEILARVYSQEPGAQKIYVKPEENKAYWVAKNNRGYVILWE